MITYSESADDISSEMLNGFFVGWKMFPTTEKHLELLKLLTKLGLGKQIKPIKM